MLNRSEFSQELDEYVVLKLDLDNYICTRRTLPAQAMIIGSEKRPEIHRDEERLLRLNFRYWELPYYGDLPGWKEDSPIFVLQNGELAGGIYVCSKNEFDENENWGQLHYFYVDPRFKGSGLHSLLFKEGITRARGWGLKGVYINTDRFMLPELYQRWGAVVWKRIPKKIARPSHSNLGRHNWLVYKIHDDILLGIIPRYASGKLVDIGCGMKPYAASTKGVVTHHIGIDHVERKSDNSQVDICASAYETPLLSNSIDTVLCTTVLEHLENPGNALREIYRILRPGGVVIASAPLFWHLHEEPRDFFRYTRYGLEHLFSEAGFEVVEIKPLSGFIVTFGQELCYALERFRSGLFRYPIRSIQFLVQWFAYRLNRYDRSYRYTWAYIAVSRKP